jgi:predicted  nucleic acid-binding Zn-ribbon protein
MSEPMVQSSELDKWLERNKHIKEELKQLNVEKDELARRTEDLKQRALALLEESRSLSIQLSFYTHEGDPQ